MKVKFILPALTEAKSPYWRPIKYSLFPPLGLATLAAYLRDDDEAEIQDEHVEELKLDDAPDIVVIQIYITNAYRSYKIADGYRKKNVFVALGGLHVTSLPDEAKEHADAIFIGPGEDIFPEFLKDFRNKSPQKEYISKVRTLETLPRIRRDLIKRNLYLVPNSIVVSRGCPHHCDFCYKDSFFSGGKSFYTQAVDDALDEIERLPGKHLYFLDDHLLGHRKFAFALFEGMKGMGRLFQGAATVDSILNGDLIEKAAEAGLRSLFVGFETLDEGNLLKSNKRQNMGRDYSAAVQRLHNLGIMINGSFVFGLDSDTKDVFHRTVEWAVKNAVTTSTFHILTPYPGTKLYKDLESEGRIVTKNWDKYDTRNVVFKPANISPGALKRGYNMAYREFYSWKNILRASLNHEKIKYVIKHFAYAGGWKKFEPLWNFIIKTKSLRLMLPFLETILSKNKKDFTQKTDEKYLPQESGKFA